MAVAGDIEALADLLRSSREMLLFTGAGISTASGIPDYRGPRGVWKTRRPVYYQEFMTSSEARIAYWQQKAEDRAAFSAATPTATHLAIVDLERAGKLGMLVTQNVDGLHRMAGSERLVEIHGTNHEVECQLCGERSEPSPHFETFARTGVAPVCHCGGPLKPATISFGQGLRRIDLEAAFAAAQRADLVVALGSTLSVTPAADIPRVAAQHAPYVIVNQGPTDHDGFSGVLRIEANVDDIVPPAVAAALA